MSPVSTPSARFTLVVGTILIALACVSCVRRHATYDHDGQDYSVYDPNGRVYVDYYSDHVGGRGYAANYSHHQHPTVREHDYPRHHPRSRHLHDRHLGHHFWD